MRKRLSIVLSMLLAVTTAAFSLSGKVDFITFWAGGVEADATEAIIKAFNAVNPDVKVTVIPKPSDNILTSIQLNLSSSAPVDVFMYWGGPGLKTLVDPGYVAPIDDIFAKLDFDNAAPGVKPLSRLDGYGNTAWCLPITTGSYEIFYNMNVWKKVGLTEKDIPRTWDQFIAVCKKIKAAGVAPLVRNVETAGAPVRAWMDKLIDRTAGADYNIALQQGKASYDDPRFRKADALWDQLRPYWHPDVGVLQYNEAYMAFAQGQAAMQLIGSWIVGSYQTEMGLVAGKDYGTFAFPIVDPKIPTAETSWGANALVLTKSGAKNDAAKAFLTFWGTQQAQQIFAKFVPGQVAVQSVQYDSPILVSINKELAGRPMHLQFTPDMTIDTDLMKVFEKRALGTITPGEAIKQLVKLQAGVKK